jgi:hypothetical protein
MYFLHKSEKTLFFTSINCISFPPTSIHNYHMASNDMLTPLARIRNGVLIPDPERLVDSYPSFPITVDCVIFGFEENELKVLLIRSDLQFFEGKWSLLGDIVRETEELEHAADRVLQQRTG